MPMEHDDSAASRGKKGNTYELEHLDNAAPDVAIATMRHVYTGERHFAIALTTTGTVYHRTNDAGTAGHLARRLQLTATAADHAGSGQPADYWQPFCEPSPVRSYGATCAEAIASAFVTI